jgi:hypothetical protein
MFNLTNNSSWALFGLFPQTCALKFLSESIQVRLVSIGPWMISPDSFTPRCRKYLTSVHGCTKCLYAKSLNVLSLAAVSLRAPESSPNVCILYLSMLCICSYFLDDICSLASVIQYLSLTTVLFPAPLYLSVSDKLEHAFPDVRTISLILFKRYVPPAWLYTSER